MSVNVGTVDRIVRLILGVVIIALGFYYASWWGLLGLLPIGTGLFGRCGLYSLLGVSTRKVKGQASHS